MMMIKRITLLIKIDLPGHNHTNTMSVGGMLEFLEAFFQERFGMFNPILTKAPDNMIQTTSVGLCRVGYYLEVNCDPRNVIMRDRSRVRNIIAVTLSEKFTKLNPIVSHCASIPKDDV